MVESPSIAYHRELKLMTLAREAGRDPVSPIKNKHALSHNTP